MYEQFPPFIPYRSPVKDNPNPTGDYGRLWSVAHCFTPISAVVGRCAAESRYPSKWRLPTGDAVLPTGLR